MRKGFTLIELLIVIGILAILATTVVLILNPAQTLAETRDTQRLSDLDTINKAIGLYLATIQNPSFGYSTNCGVDGSGNSIWLSSGAGATLAPVIGTLMPFTPSGTPNDSLPSNNFLNVDGNGWVPIDLTQISGGSPMPVLPADPSERNDASAQSKLSVTGHFYAFQCGAGATPTYEIDANMESTKFSNLGSADVESTDGGDQPAIYEIGNAPGLNL